MTITLQDLQVLNEKATQGEWLVDHLAPNLSRIALQEDGAIATVDRWNSGVAGDYQENRANAEFIAALVNYYRSGAFQRLAELADRHEHDCPTFREFFNKYALGSKLPPSCLMCGRIVHERAVEHAELPDIYICADCKQLAEDGERWREYLSHHAVEQRAEVIATIDSARAPSVKEGK
jgi:hypothetical protein